MKQVIIVLTYRRSSSLKFKLLQEMSFPGQTIFVLISHYLACQSLLHSNVENNIYAIMHSYLLALSSSFLSCCLLHFECLVSLVESESSKLSSKNHTSLHITMVLEIRGCQKKTSLKLAFLATFFIPYPLFSFWPFYSSHFLFLIIQKYYTQYHCLLFLQNPQHMRNLGQIMSCAHLGLFKELGYLYRVLDLIDFIFF